MPADANLELQSEVSKAADFNGASLAIGSTPRRGMYARVIYKNTSVASGSATADFYLDVTYDGGTTWQSGSNAPFRGGDTISIPSGSANAVSGELYIPIEVSPRTVGTPVGVRLTLEYTATSSPSSPNVTYNAYIVPARHEGPAS